MLPGIGSNIIPGFFQEFKCKKLGPKDCISRVYQDNRHPIITMNG